MAKLCAPGGDPYTYKGHSGIDFLRGGSWYRKAFYASGPGVVRRLSKNAAGGNWIVVKYDAIPYEVGYAHMDNHNGCPAPGTRVNRGTRLGYVGALGTNVTGPHIHVEIIGRATSAAVWDYFDKTCWVTGAASPAEVGGSGWDEAKKQRFLTQIGLDTGGIGNGWGPKSTAATKQFQTWVGLNPDGVFGKDTIAVADTILGGGKFVTRPTKDIQTYLAGKGYPVGPADGAWGVKASLSTYMLQAAEGLKKDAQWGAATDAKAFPVTPTPTPDPVPGRNATSRPLKDIQAFLKVSQTGVWDKATADAVGEFQENEGITVDYVWGVASDGLAFPPAGSIHGIDYSFARPDPKLLVSRGVQLVGRYLWRDVQTDGKTNKGISKTELSALNGAGLDVFYIYEEDGKELLGGSNAGMRVATAAEQFRAGLGIGPVPIYFNVDFDASDADMPAILDALRAIGSMIGKERVGLYAGYKVIKAAFDAGVITWGFQTYSWSGGQWDQRAQLQQWANGQWGGSVDFTRAMVSEFGQTPVGVTPDPDPDPEPQPEMVEVPREEIEAMRKTLEKWLA